MHELGPNTRPGNLRKGREGCCEITCHNPLGTDVSGKDDAGASLPLGGNLIESVSAAASGNHLGSNSNSATSKLRNLRQSAEPLWASVPSRKPGK